MPDRVLEGKIALITGGASGIGRATARLFAREGAAVAIADSNEAAGREVAAEIAADGGRVICERVDVTSADDCERAVRQTLNAFGGLHILFNNAGFIRRASVAEFIPAMARSGGGSIINTASGWGLAAGPRAAVYCASKAAVVLLTKAMAIDHGAQGIRVNCVCPGDTETPMLAEEAQQLGQPSGEFLVEAAHRPLRRIGQPEDIAAAVLYLASDAAAFVTGISLVVDGGGLA